MQARAHFRSSCFLFLGFEKGLGGEGGGRLFFVQRDIKQRGKRKFKDRIEKKKEC
jgi:hypothetical protein